ncbi:MAG: M13 family metallopeptidase [Polyangiaceae bacterium]
MRSRSFGLVLSVWLAACQTQAPALQPARPSVAASSPAAPPEPPAAGPKPELGSFGVDLNQGNPAIRPGNDFYRRVNGRWLDTYQLKPDEMRFNSFVKLQYRSEEQVKAIIEELSRAASANGTPQQQIADYFKSYMDAPALEARGIAPLRDELAAIAKIRTREQLIEAFGSASARESNAPFMASVGIDRRDPDRYILNIAHAGLGLPDRSYYLEDTFKKVLVAYEANIVTMLGFTGLAPAEAKKAASLVVALETAIAREHWPRAELRDLDKTTNVTTRESFEAQYKDYPWRQHLKAAGIDVAKVTELNVYAPSAVAPLSRLVSSTPLATWRYYLTYHLITNHAALLGDSIDNASFEFFGKVVNGQPAQRDRWKRAIMLVGKLRGLGEALGKLYIERHFPPDAATKMNDLVENARAALKERVQALSWMGPQTKREALEKLGSFNAKIGGPKKWRDFSGIAIAPGELMANYRAVRKYWYEDEVGRLGKPTDRDEWQMTPQTINAYYNRSFNEIVFPAAILQPPFFDPNADPAVNYGAIGGVIGHEMGHGFDDQGSKADARGVKRNWWTAEDRGNFETRTQALVKQYAGFEPLLGQKINGSLTLGENIGDLGGISIALSAHLRSLGGKPAPVLDGYTGEQRFFLAWAQVWAGKQRDEYLLKVLKSDPHSPTEFRVNGVVRNVDAWYQAFDVKPGDALYLAPSERVRIW